MIEFRPRRPLDQAEREERRPVSRLGTSRMHVIGDNRLLLPASRQAGREAAPIPLQSCQAPRQQPRDHSRAGLSRAARHRPGTAAHGIHHRSRAGEDPAARPANRVSEGRLAGRGSQADLRQRDDLGRGPGLAVAARARGRTLFRHEELLHYGPIMSAAAEVAHWRARRAGTVHAIHRDMMRAAFHVISNTMLAGGAEEMFNAIEKGHADYYSGVNWWVMYTLLGLPHWLPRPGGQSHARRTRPACEAGRRLVQARRGRRRPARICWRCARHDPETGRHVGRASRRQHRVVPDGRLRHHGILPDVDALSDLAEPGMGSANAPGDRAWSGAGPVTSAHVEHLRRSNRS